MKTILFKKPSTLILLVVCAFAPRLLAQTNPPTATFSVVAGGSAPLSYQRRFSSTNDPAGPFEWIDPDTGHRVVQLSREPGSESLYFNLNPFTPDGRKMVITTPDGIAMIDLQTRQVENIVAGRAHVIMVGRKTGQIYYGTTNRTVFAVDPVTKVTRTIVTLPRGEQVATVNADETLLAGTVTGRTDWGTNRDFFDGGPNRRNDIQTADERRGKKGKMMEDRLAKHYPMELFFYDIATGETKKFNHCNRSEEHTSELQSPCNLVCRLL